MPTGSRPKPLVVVILDGWGISFIEKGNAIAAAETPNMDTFAHYYPSASLLAASIEVGLPWGEVGNSETGHSNIGAGEVQYQSLPLIDKAIEDKSFFNNEMLLQAMRHAYKHHSNIHIMGLFSPGGVHSHMNHLYALLEFLAKQNLQSAFLELLAKDNLQERVYLHLFTDGRDVPPQSALTYLTKLEETIGKFGIGKIASVVGRFYAMDRNQNWERTKQAYDLLTGGPRAAGASTARQALQQAYNQQLSDEMVPPTAITRGGSPLATIKDNDVVIFFNFRPDRARQITRAFVEKEFPGFARTVPANLFFVTMTQYDPDIPAPSLYVEEPVANPLARIISQAGLRQLHIAETEKYAHITYYLNGGHEKPFPGEDHVLIRSSSVKNFADEPAMAAEAITERVKQELKKQLYDVYFINYANADMVGHTGNFEATVQACQVVDACLGQLYQEVLAAQGAMIVTADHGNAEEKIHPQTGEIETEHTSNPVPLHYIVSHLQRTTPKTAAEVATLFSSPIGVLADVGPTILEILQLPKPETMTGISLLASLQ